MSDERTSVFGEAGFNQWMSQFFELQMAATVTWGWYGISKEDPSLGFVAEITQHIQQHWSEHNGFIIILPMRFYLYGAGLLSQLYAKAGKPVVITYDAIRMIDPVTSECYGEMEMKANIVNASQAATSEVAGPISLVGSRIVDPLYLVDLHAEAGEPQFGTEDARIMGRLDFGVQLAQSAPRRRSDGLVPDMLAVHSRDIQLWSQSDLEAGAIPREGIRGLIVDAEEGASVSLSIVQRLPDATPSLLVSDDHMQVYMGGSLLPVDADTVPLASSQFLLSVFDGSFRMA